MRGNAPRQKRRWCCQDSALHSLKMSCVNKHELLLAPRRRCTTWWQCRPTFITTVREQVAVTWQLTAGTWQHLAAPDSTWQHLTGGTRPCIPYSDHVTESPCRAWQDNSGRAPGVAQGTVTRLYSDDTLTSLNCRKWFWYVTSQSVSLLKLPGGWRVDSVNDGGAWCSQCTLLHISEYLL